PRVVFIQIVSVERDAQLAENSRVEWIVRPRREKGFAGMHQRTDAEVDSFSHAGGDENVAHSRNALARGLAANRFERFRNAGRRRVAILAIAHGFVGGFNDVGRRLEIEVERVADVEWENFVSLLCDFVGYAGEVANGVA